MASSGFSSNLCCQIHSSGGPLQIHYPLWNIYWKQQIWNGHKTVAGIVNKIFYTVKNWPQCKTRSNQCTSLSLLPLSSLAIACLSSPTSWTHTSLPQPDQERLCPPDSMTSRHEQIRHHTNLVSSPPFQYMDNSNGPNPVVGYDDWYSWWYGNRCIILFQSLLTMWGSHHQKYPLTLLLVCNAIWYDANGRR